MEDELVLPEDTPAFVKESDFKKIDWNKQAVTYADNIIGNENKSGVIGADVPSLSGQKWMWHLWGNENLAASKLTVVGLHKETGTVHQILTTGWTINLSGANNRADAHVPSSVKIPQAGEWAILLYADEKLFDEFIYEIKE